VDSIVAIGGYHVVMVEQAVRVRPRSKSSFFMDQQYRLKETRRVLPPRYFQGIKSYRFVDYGEVAAYLECKLNTVLGSGRLTRFKKKNPSPT